TGFSRKGWRSLDRHVPEQAGLPGASRLIRAALPLATGKVESGDTIGSRQELPKRSKRPALGSSAAADTPVEHFPCPACSWCAPERQAGNCAWSTITGRAPDPASTRDAGGARSSPPSDLVLRIDEQLHAPLLQQVRE